MADQELKLFARVGEEIRDLRKSRGLNLKFVSEKTHLSISLLSQIENGKANVSISNLAKIAYVLGAELTFFLKKPSYSKLEITRKIELEDNPTSFDGHRAYPIAVLGALKKSERRASERRAVDIYKLTLKKNPQGAPFFRSHPPVGVVAVVISGVALLHCDEEQCYLYVGDMVKFTTEAPHAYESVTDMSELMILHYPLRQGYETGEKGGGYEKVSERV